MNAVILAGGLGTRLGEQSKTVPKPMTLIDGKPVLQHQIELLEHSGITEITLVVSHLSHVIESFFGDGSRFGVSIRYIESEKSSGTTGAVLRCRDLTSDFIVLYGDTMLSIDIQRFISFHQSKKNSLATLFVHPNDHPGDSDLIETDDTDRIIAIHPKPHPKGLVYKNLVNAGLYIFSPKIFPLLRDGEDFGRDTFPKLLKIKKRLYAYSSPEYVKDMGTPERLSAVQQDIREKKHLHKRLDQPQRAVFLDRDGVIIQQVDQLHKLEHVDIFDFTAKAIKRINDKGYLAIVITNQPMVARGLLSLQDLSNIHKHIETHLGNVGAKLDAIYYCPHHPDKGYEGEIEALKIVCDCRKPSPGLIHEAVKRFNIELSQSFFIGDTTSDLLTAQNAGVRSVLVRTGYGGSDHKYSAKPDYTYDNLLTAISELLP